MTSIQSHTPSLLATSLAALFLSACSMVSETGFRSDPVPVASTVECFEEGCRAELYPNFWSEVISTCMVNLYSMLPWIQEIGEEWPSNYCTNIPIDLDNDVRCFEDIGTGTGLCFAQVHPSYWVRIRDSCEFNRVYKMPLWGGWGRTCSEGLEGDADTEFIDSFCTSAYTCFGQMPENGYYLQVEPLCALSLLTEGEPFCPEV